jgi:hypothetical protein
MGCNPFRGLLALVYLGDRVVSSAMAMCPDAVYLISSESISKEYRPICLVYSLGRKLPTGGLGNGPEMKYSRSAQKCK